MVKQSMGFRTSLALFALGTVVLGSVLLSANAWAADGSGTNTVVPTSVTVGSTGNSPTFTFTAGETMDSGAVNVVVPSAWSAPQGTAGVAGYTTVTSAMGTVGTVLNALDTATGWAGSGPHMTLSADTGDTQEGTASLLNTIGTAAAANEQWHFNYGAATNWGTAALGNLRVGMWVKASAATASGDFSWQDDDSIDLATPLDTIAIPALAADTWTYTSVTLGATTRPTISSYGFRYTNDIGAVTLKADSLSSIFSTNDTNNGWSGDTSITDSALTTSGNFKEGTGAVRCTYAAGAGTGTSGDCWDNENGVITLGPGTTVSVWVRSSVALNAGDFAFTTDNTTNMGSPEDIVSLPALAAGTWTYVTLTAANSGDARSFGVRQLIDKGAMTIDLDAIGKQVDAADATTGWIYPTGDNMTLSSDTTTFHEGTASLKTVIPTETLAGDSWFQALGASQDWSAYTKVGFWIRSTVATAAGDLTFQYSSASDLSSPIASVNIGALAADTWTYQVLALAGTRTSVNSYGINYAVDIGAATVYLDDVLIGPSVPTFPGSGVITFRLLQLALGQTMTITYGAGGGASGVTAPTVPGVSTFTTQTRVSDAGSFQNIVSSPTITVQPGPTTEFTLNAPADITAGTRAAYTVTRKDVYGNLGTVGAQTVYLYSTSTGVNKAFYNVASGGSPVTSVTIADGSSTADFWMYDEEVGTWTITASDNASAPDGAAGIDDASDSIAVNGATTAVYELNDPGNMPAGTRLGYTVTRKDPFGNAVTVGSETVSLYSTSTGANKAFYAASSGGSPITSIVITGGNSTANFWLYDEEVGTWTITASDHASAPDGATGIDDATDSVTVQVGAATKFVMEDPTDGVVATNIVVTVRAEDAFGNLVTTEERDVTLNTSGSATGAGLVNIVAGVGTKTISDTVVETVLLTLTDSETTGLNVSSTQNVNFTSGPTRQFLLNDPGDMVAGTQLAYTVTRQDTYGNPVTTGSDTVYLYSDAPGANEEFYDAESGSQITSLTIGTGASTAQFWYYDDQVGSATVTASDNASAPDGLVGKDDATDAVTVTPAAISQFLLNDPGSMEAGTRLGYTVARQDAFGNPVTSGSQTVSLYSDSTGPKAFYGAASGGSPLFSVTINDTSSEASFWYYDEKAGTPTVTASDNGSAPDGATGIDDATDSVTVTPAATGQFLLDNPGDITVGTRAGYTVTRKDSFGNITTSGSNTVYLYSDSTGVAEFYDAASGGSTLTSLIIGSGGSTGAFWYTDDTAGNWTVTASDNASAPDGAAGIDDGTDPITVTSIAIVATRLIIMDPTDGTAGDSILVTIKAVDDVGSVETTFAGSVTLNLSGSATGGGSVTITNGIGTASIQDAVAESVHLSLTDSGSTGLNVSSTQDVLFAVGPTGQYALNDPGDTTAGTRLAYTVTRKDQSGNLVTTGMETASLYSTSTSAVFYDAAFGGSSMTTVSFAESSSTAAFWYADEQAGSATVTVSDHVTAPDGAVGIDDATDAVAVTPGPVSQFLLNDPGDMSTDTRIGYTVTRKDTFGNVVTTGSNTVYLFSNSTGAKAFYDAAAAGNQMTSVVIAEGNASAVFWYFDDTAGTWTVTASDHASSPDGDTGIVDDTDVILVSEIPIVATRLIILDPADTTVGSNVTVTVKAVDNADNLDTSFAGQVTLVLSGSATGEGLVNMVGGIGTKTITDAVAETVTLSLSDTETTGLNVSSTQTVTFRRTGGGGVPTPVSAPEVEEVVPPAVSTILRVNGQAYPDARVALQGQTASGTVPLEQGVTTAADGTFTLEYAGPFERFSSYAIVVTDKAGLSTSPVPLSPEIRTGLTTVVSVLAPPTMDVVRAAVLRGTPLVLFGSAVPGSRVEISVDGGDDLQTAQAGGDGSYRISVDTLAREYGSHLIRVRQVLTNGTVSAEGVSKTILVSRVFNVKTDLNGDGVVNIIDWSAFLVKWKSTNETLRQEIDFNEDGKVDAIDFSIFVRSVRQ